MNRKIFAAFFSLVLLCSCGNGGTAEVSETETESVTVTSAVASETAVTTTAAETASEAVSEVSEMEEKAPITRDFFNDDVVFEEVMVPVKDTNYNKDRTENTVKLYEYDTAGNITKCLEHNYYADYMYDRTYEYDYNPNGTYNSVTYFLRGEADCICRFDENGYCVELISNVGSEYEYMCNYKYEFDDSGRLIRKENEYGFVEYSYDENGRIIYETHGKPFGDIWYYKYEYGNSFENVYIIDLAVNEEILWHIMEKDENGNTVKETYNEGDVSEYVTGRTFAEYEYDSMNRLIYENHTVSEDYMDGTDRYNVYSITYEYDNDKLKKETLSFDRYNESTEYFYDETGRIVKEVYIFEGGANELTMQYPAEDTTEYFYNEDGTIISQTHDMNGVLIKETEYAMIPKIKTDIEYLGYYEVKP